MFILTRLGDTYMTAISVLLNEKLGSEMRWKLLRVMETQTKHFQVSEIKDDGLTIQ